MRMSESQIVVRKAMPDDLPVVAELIGQAKQLLHNDGIDQWQDGYPDRATLQHDIASGWGRLLVLDGVVVATAAVIDGPDPNYRELLEGAWKPSQSERSDYATIHRVAVASGYRGRHLATEFYRMLIDEVRASGFHELRVDTHPDNRRMQHLIEGFGFDRVGVAFMRGNRADRRYAYQLFF